MVSIDEIWVHMIPSLADLQLMQSSLALYLEVALAFTQHHEHGNKLVPILLLEGFGQVYASCGG